MDWWVLDLVDDPTPGDPVVVRQLARRVQLVADDAARAEQAVRGLSGDDAVTSWLGLAGEVFKGALDDFPGQLRKLADSYGQCASALSRFGTELDTAQDKADRALVAGREAAAELASLQTQLSAARTSSDSAGRAVDALDRPLSAGAEPPDADQVRSATRTAQTAALRVGSLTTAAGGASDRLEAAKRMARDAEQLRQDAGDRAKDRLYDASDAGIEPNSWWEDFTSGAAKVWDVTISVAKVVVAVLGIVVLIVGGPLAWVVVGLSVLILADALMKVRNGEGGWLDVGIAALGLIPGTKGLTSLGALRTAFRGGGTLGALSHLGGAARTTLSSMATAVRSGAGSVRARGSRVLADGLRRGDAAFLGGSGAEGWMAARSVLHRATGGQFTAQGDLLVRRWTPAGPQGPLGGLDAEGLTDPRALAATFRSGSYDEVLSRRPQELYRSFADRGTVNGQFWSFDAPRGPLHTQLDLALLPEWNTTTRAGAFTTLPQATHVAEARVPAGSTFFTGPTAAQTGTRAPGTTVLGGGGQVVFPGGVPAEWLSPGIGRVGG